MNLLKKISQEFNSSYVMMPSVLLILGTLAFLGLSKQALSIKSSLLIILFVVFFAIGERVAIKKYVTKFNTSQKTLYYMGSILFVISLVTLYLNFFAAGGIPLFNAAIRRFMNPELTYISFIMVPASAMIIASFSKHKYAKRYTFLIMFMTAFFMALTGYRTEVMAAFLVCTLTAYYTKIFEFKHLTILAVIALIMFSGMSVMRTSSLEYSLRAATTLEALNYVIDEALPFGVAKGYVEFADFVDVLSATPIYSGRVLISTLLNIGTIVSITSTLYGPPIADFGVGGLFIFLYFGIILGISYKTARKRGGIFSVFHALLLSFLLLSIETGLVDMIVWMYFFVATIFYMVVYNVK